MKKLRKLETYITQLPVPIGANYQNVLISFVELRKDGIDLTIEEGRLIGRLMYHGLTGYIPFKINGEVKEVAVHPIVEAVGEFLHGFAFMSQMKISIVDTEDRFELGKSIFRKFGHDPDLFLEGARISWNKLDVF